MENYGINRLLRKDELQKLTSTDGIIELLCEIENFKSEDYDKEDIFNKNNISREALAILAYLNLTYWANEEQKKELINMYRKNEHPNVRDNYNFIIKKENANVEIEKNDNTSKDVQMIKYNESKLKKLINKIKDFFRRHSKR